ncbi:MAG TPA: hypothetical protein VFQ91_08315 [Bryobacteraceae bacterium]|nr:hypothetical protein [Bryobacteraceae bacterium]
MDSGDLFSIGKTTGKKSLFANVNLKNVGGLGDSSLKNTINVEVPKELMIHHIDVGQGEATLIMLLENEVVSFTVLIDGGRYTRGGGTIVRYLREINVRNVDLMICTHHDADHIEGLIRVLEDEKNSQTDRPITVGKIIDRQSPLLFPDPFAKEFTFDDLSEEQYAEGRRFCEVEIEGEKEEEKKEAPEDKSETIDTEFKKESAEDVEDQEQLRKIIARFKKLVGDRGMTIKPGTTFAVSNSKNPELKLTCLHIDSAGDTPSEENNYSIAILLEYGKFRYFTGGDLESVHEDKFIAALKGDSHLCAFKCGHHGSRNSTSAEFLAQTEARRGFISCGHHSYYHPDADLVSRLCDSAHLKQFFLTNCYYNRLGINSNYLGQELTLLGNLTDLMIETAREAEDACANWRQALNGITRPGSTVFQAKGLAQQFVDRTAELTVLCGALRTHTLRLAGPHDPALTDLKKEIKTLHEALVDEKKKVAANSNFANWNQNAEYGFINNPTVDAVKAKIRRLADRTKAAQDMMDRYTTAEQKIQALTEKGGNADSLIKGVVAGGDGHLGTIVLHITSAQAILDEHAYHIGHWNFSFDEEWQWTLHCCNPDAIAPLFLAPPKWNLGAACAIARLKKIEAWSPQRQWVFALESDTLVDFSLVTGSSGAQNTKRKEPRELSSQEKKELLRQEKYEREVREQLEQNVKRQKTRDAQCASCGGGSARTVVYCTHCNAQRNVCRHCRQLTNCPMH